MTSKQATRGQFAPAADAYAVSPGHAAGRDLDRVVELVQPRPDMLVLDVATGGGHVAAALAPHVRAVIASDLTGAMAARAQGLAGERGLTNVVGATADAEDLPFATAAFDAVTCRIAPHHFADLAASVAEIFRVLRPGGVFVVEDSTVPDDDSEAAEFLNAIEAWRDPTHVRSISPSAWADLLQRTGFRPEPAELFPKRHPLTAWFDRSRTPTAARRRVLDALAGAPDSIKARFQVEFDADDPVAYTDHKVVIRAGKPA